MTRAWQTIQARWKRAVIDRLLFDSILKRFMSNNDNLFAIWEQNHLRRLLRDLAVDCVFDVGANCGQYAQMLRHKAGFQGLIISFEPIPSLAAELRELASSDPNWVVEESALGRHDGRHSFQVMRESEFSSLSIPVQGGVSMVGENITISEKLEVSVSTLARAYDRLKLLHGFQRPFLKLDTQGLDVAIVSESPQCLRNFLGLQTELAIKALYQDSVDYREALRVYEGLGYVLSALVPNNAGHYPLLLECDGILIRDDLIPSGVSPLSISP